VKAIFRRIGEVTAELNLASCNGPGWPLSEMTVFRIYGEEVTPEAYLAFLEKKLEERKSK
jgi:hypothetical protein